MAKETTCAVRWSMRALRDLDRIAAYIAQDNPKAARRWVAQLRETALKAAHMPKAARVVPEIRREDVREVFLRSYRIVYGVRDDHIFVYTVFGGGKGLMEEEIG